MIQKHIIDAYITLTHLGGIQMPARCAFQLYQLRKKLETSYQFCAEQERMVITKYHGTVQNGMISFPDESDATMAQAALREISEMTVELEYEPVTVKLDDLEGGSITMDDIANLDGFVVFA